MRAPRRQRPKRREVSNPPLGVDLMVLAKRAAYVGSPEHKDRPTFAGRPRPRADATICDPELADRQRLSQWIRKAIEESRVGAPWEGDFPRYVWHRVGEIVYEGRLVNRVQGEYKGYPLSPEEVPDGV